MKKSPIFIIGCIAAAVVVLIGIVYLTSSYTLKSHERAQEKAFELEEKEELKRIRKEAEEIRKEYGLSTEETKKD